MHRWRRAIGGHPGATDAALAATVTAAVLLTTVAAPGGGGLTAPAVLTALLASGVLAVRRQHPLVVLAVSAVAAEAYLIQYHGHQGSVVVVAPLIALYTVADLSGARRAPTVGVLVLLVFGAVHVLIKRSSWIGTDNLTLAALGGVALAAGVASRNRRAYLAEVQARAAQAEADREAEATRRVTDERLRIARDLHDAVGHQLALISVQARVAAHLLDTSPQQARQAMGHVHEATRTALDELTDTIGLLRQPGDPATPTTPAVGVAGLAGLLAGFRHSGLTIEAQTEGVPAPLPAPVDLTAYRVVQEALTNVCRHAGPVPVSVLLSYRPGELGVVVENAAPATTSSPAPPGHGLPGMRERVGARGGPRAAGPRPDGGYRVSAVLPRAGVAG